MEPECLGREGEQRACGREGIHEREGGGGGGGGGGGVSVIWKGEELG